MGLVSFNISFNLRGHQVIPYYPAAPTPHWSSRYGFVTVITKAQTSTDFDYMYVLGGDSYDGDDTREEHPPGGHATRRPNGLKNDVWRTTGAAAQLLRPQLLLLLLLLL